MYLSEANKIEQDIRVEPSRARRKELLSKQADLLKMIYARLQNIAL